MYIIHEFVKASCNLRKGNKLPSSSEFIVQQQLTSQACSPCTCDTSAKNRLLELRVPLAPFVFVVKLKWWNTYHSHKCLGASQDFQVHVHEPTRKKISKWCLHQWGMEGGRQGGEEGGRKHTPKRLWSSLYCSTKAWTK